jgi:hypothetical protein
VRRLWLLLIFLLLPSAAWAQGCTTNLAACPSPRFNALTANSLNVPSISIGSLNNTPIGNTTPSTGAFTSLSSTSFSTTALNNIPIGSITPSTGAFTTLSATGTFTGSASALLGTGLAGTTNLRIHAANANSAALQFYKGATATSGHRWDILTGASASGDLLQGIAYDNTGTQTGTLFSGNRSSGLVGQGAPWWSIAPFLVGTARATTPNGNIGGFIGGGTGLIDTQPTTTLGANPITTTNAQANVKVTWTGSGATGTGVIGTAGTTSETWVNITGATAVGGLTLSGWYKATRFDDNTFTVNAGSPATSGATGGGAAVTVTPSFGTSTMETFSTVTTSSTTFPIQDIKLFVVNPAFYQPIGGKGPNYQQRWSQFVTAPDTTGNNQFIHVGWEQDLINRGGDFGYQPESQTATDFTAAYYLVSVAAVPTYATGGGTVQNWNTGITYGGVSKSFYDAITIQPRALVGATEDTVSSHGGVGLDFFGSYVTLQTNPFATSVGLSTVVVSPVTGAATRMVNGDIFTLPSQAVINGVTLAAGNYTMSSVSADAFTITGVGSAGSSGSGGGAGLYGYFPKQAPYAPAQWWGEWTHGISTKNFKSDSGGIIDTQPGNGIQWNDGTGTASITGTEVSAGNVGITMTRAGTGQIVVALPTSAPSTHCALWANSGIVTLTTCP